MADGAVLRVTKPKIMGNVRGLEKTSMKSRGWKGKLFCYKVISKKRYVWLTKSFVSGFSMGLLHLPLPSFAPRFRLIHGFET